MARIMVFGITKRCWELYIWLQKFIKIYLFLIFFVGMTKFHHSSKMHDMSLPFNLIWYHRRIDWVKYWTRCYPGNFEVYCTVNKTKIIGDHHQVSTIRNVLQISFQWEYNFIAILCLTLYWWGGAHFKPR